jgi:spore coat polysaccharide biosynthesis protein SpsF
MKVGCLLSVREKATRLHKKVLLDVAGKPLTARLLERISMANEIDEVILSTSSHPGDKVLIDIAKKEGVNFFCGSENDKLDRYYQTALKFKLDAVVIVDGDDLFCFPEIIDKISRLLKKNKTDCVCVNGLPVGAASTGIMVDALRRVLELKDEEDTEVWGGYFFDSGYFSTAEITITDPLLNHPEIRLTLDYQEDYDFIRRTIEALGNRVDFTSNELMELLINIQPELQLINFKAQKKYEVHLKEATPVRFKDK